MAIDDDLPPRSEGDVRSWAGRPAGHDIPPRLRRAAARRAGHLREVPTANDDHAAGTIGRLIAQTALIADGVQRPGSVHGLQRRARDSRLLGWFRR